MIDFLRAILPHEGVYYAVGFMPDGTKRHYAKNSIEELANTLTFVDSKGLNTYFACSAYRQDHYIEWSDKLQKDIRKYRTRHNVRTAKALWLDFDVKEGDQHKYASRQEAVDDIKRLVALGLPPPIIVSSGYGFHLYWPLQDELLPDAWSKYASYLKAVLKAAGFKSDPARTADICSILRPPATHNYKKEAPVEVKCLGVKGPYSIGDIFLALKRISKQFPSDAEPHMHTRTQSVVDLGTLNVNLPPADPIKVVEQCAQMAHFKTLKGVVSEPFWYASLGVLAFCEQGETYAHEWSSGHPAYSRQDTQAKLEQWRAVATGPTTCAKFEQEDSTTPTRCATCRFKGKISSPAQLGVKIEKAEDVVLEGGIKVEVPEGFFRGKDGLYVVTDKQADIKNRFFDYDLYITDIMTHPNGHEVATFHYNRPHKGHTQFQGRTSLFNKLDQSWEFFSNNGVYLPYKTSAETMTQYCRSFLAELHARKATMTTHSNLGWKDDGSFLVGKYVVSQDSIQVNPMIAKTVLPAQYIDVAGELQPWVDNTAVFEAKDLHILAFAFLAGLSAPMYLFTGYGGVAVNMVAHTGYGKSSIQRMINSLYGNPEAMLMKSNATQKSLIHWMGLMSNLPVCIDEVGNMRKDRISQLLLTVTMGQEGTALTADRKMMEVNSWNTSVILSSNHSLMGKLGDMKSDYVAEAMRLIELRVPRSALFSDPEKAKNFNKTLLANYGKAGLAFIKQLVGIGREGILKELKSAEEHLHTAGHIFTSQERFWENAFICALAAGRIAQRIGLIKFSPEAAIKTTFMQISQLRKEIDHSKQDAFDMLSHYVNENFDKFITVIKIGNSQRTETPPKAGRIEGRITFWMQGDKIIGGEMAISVIAIRTWLTHKFADFTEFKNDLLKEEALISDSKTTTLGSGTPFRTPPCRCCIFTLSHVRLRDMMDKYVEPQSNVIGLSVDGAKHG